MVFNQIVNVVGRTAAVAAVQRIFFFVKLCERSFDKRGRRADDSRHPHPEHSTCASGGDCSDNADQISHTDTRCGGNDQCLKRRKAAFFIFLFRQGTDHVRKQTDGKKTCPDRKIDAGWDQQKNQKGDSETAAARERNRKKIAPEKVVDCGDEIDNHVFKNPHFKIFAVL